MIKKRTSPSHTIFKEATGHFPVPLSKNKNKRVLDITINRVKFVGSNGRKKLEGMRARIDRALNKFR